MRLVRGHTRHPPGRPDSGLGTLSLPKRGGGDASEGLPPWASGPSSVSRAGDRLPFVVRGSSLEWSPLQTSSFWKLSVTAPGADCQVILSLSVEEDRYGKGTADCLSPQPNSLPSHHPTLARASRRGCPLDGSQPGVKKLDLGVAFSDGGELRVLRTWWKKRCQSISGWAPSPRIQPSLPHRYLK